MAILDFRDSVHGVINLKYSNRIQIFREDLDRGKVLYTIVHKKSPLHRAKSDEIPPIHKSHLTFEEAEDAALYLLANYEKYFMS